MSRVVLSLAPINNFMSSKGEIYQPWRNWFNTLHRAHTQFFPTYNLTNNTTNGVVQAPIPTHPSYSTIERDSLVGMVNGGVIYNSTSQKFNFYENGAWVEYT